MNHLKKILIVLLSNAAIPWAASAAVSNAELAEVYSAVVKQLISVDDTYGGTLKPKRIFFKQEILSDCPYPEPVDWSRITKDTPEANFPSPPPPIGCDRKIVCRMPAETQNGIQSRLSSENIKVGFIKNEASLRFNKRSGAVVGGGVIITVGEVALSATGVASVNGSFYVARLAGGENRYEFQKTNGRWKLVRTLPGLVS